MLICQDLNYHEEPIVSEWLGEIHHILKDSCRLRISRSPPTSPISIKQTMFKKSQIAWDVVITSMLTTMGSCCVVGKSEEQINGVWRCILSQQICNRNNLTNLFTILGHRCISIFSSRHSSISLLTICCQ